MIIREEQIGDCRLILGDCLSVLPTLGPIDTIVSDPPFGMGFVSNFRLLETKHEEIDGDENEDLLLWCCDQEAVHSKYIFCRWDNLKSVPAPKSLITWVKNNHSMGDLEHEHGRQTEVCLFYPGDGHFFPTGRPNDVIKCGATGNEYHPTEKPVPLMEVVVGWTTGTVIDPFMGSGSTGLACMRLKRKFVGIEKVEKHFVTACRRIEQAAKQFNLF